MDMQYLHIQVLLLADAEDDYRLVRDLLSNLCASGGTLRWASDYAVAMDSLLGGKFDVCLLDHRLGPRTGLEILEEVTRAGCPTPVIFLTDNGNYELDLEAMRIGAADYLTKDQLSAPLLERSIRYATERRRKKEAYNDLERQVKERTADLARVNAELKREVEERKRAEEMMRLSEKELQRAEAVAHFGNWEFIMGRNEARVSNGVKLICGLEESTLPIAYLRSLVLPEYRPILHDAIKGLIEENRPCNIEFKIREAD